MPPFILAAVGFCGLLIFLRFSFPYLAPFFLGLFLAFIMDVPVSLLEARGWPRAITSLVLTVLAFVTLPAALVVLLLQLWDELQGLSLFPGLFSNSADFYSERLGQLFDAIAVLDTGLGLQTLLKWALAIPDLVLIWTIAAVSAYFFCRDKWVLARFFAKQLPRFRSFSPRQVYSDTFGFLWDFIQVQLLFMLISTAVSIIFFAILQVPYPLLSGFLVGICDLVPILGPGLVYFALAGLQLFMGNTYTALALGIGYLILLLLRQWGEPYLVGDRLGFHPLAALAGLYVAFRFWGPFGAMLAPALMVFLKALFSKEQVTQ
ncbi:MAG: AI-2E family transporter [Firmicutes bacterium]|nr:AI-2E family transporter [Bacillota bacterium]